MSMYGENRKSQEDDKRLPLSVAFIPILEPENSSSAKKEIERRGSFGSQRPPARNRRSVYTPPVW